VRILFLTHRLPYAPNRGDRIRAYHLLRRMHQFADVDVVSLVHDADEAAHRGDVEQLASAVWPVAVSSWSNLLGVPAALWSGHPLTHVLLDGRGLRAALDAAVSRGPDLILAYCSGMARLALEPPLRGYPFVHDMVDVDSAKWASLAGRSSVPRRWVYRREAKRLEAFERHVTRLATATLVVNARERNTLTSIAPGARVAVVENGVDVDAFRSNDPPARRLSVVFTGVFNYAPNERGAIWLIEQAWPRIVHRHPDATLALVGAHPTAALKSRAARTPSITVTGAVPDIRPYLWNATVAVAPLHTARGLQNKVLEALAAGLPVVTTSAVAGGLPDAVLQGCVVADSADEFADGVACLLDLPPDERRRRAGSVDLQGLTWSVRLEGLESLLTQAASSTSAR
jgi:sugar transferase (PEP-CTERM/EpsH1 system associated)